MPLTARAPRRVIPASALVAVAYNSSYNVNSVSKALATLLENLDPPLPVIVKRGSRVLVKVNMGCSGARDPALRLTTHPTIAEAIINALHDCGAVVSFGDDVARAGKHCAGIYERTGMAAVAKRSGARLVDFVAAGARTVPSGLLYPRTHLITNAYWEADIVINAANCRSGPSIVTMSAAIKNMFGCVVGQRKQLMHDIFGSSPRNFGRAIADIHRVARADLSFLDLTTVSEGFGIAPAVRPVGLVLASTDPVALDTVAAHSIGYEQLPRWTTHYGRRMGLGWNTLDRIVLKGDDWQTWPKARLAYPSPTSPEESVWETLSRRVNNTILRQVPVISANRCNGCGECFERCPVKSIHASSPGVYEIDRGSCADCGCCIKTCEIGAIERQPVGWAKWIRGASRKLKPAPEASARS